MEDVEELKRAMQDVCADDREVVTQATFARAILTLIAAIERAQHDAGTAVCDAEEALKLAKEATDA